MKIQNKIVEYVANLKDTVIHLQTGLLFRIFSHLLENPEALSPQLRRLANSMTTENDPEIKKELAKQFHRLIIDDMQKKFEETGLTFLPTTWNNLKILENDRQRGRP